MNKFFCLLLTIILTTLFLTGCWNYREIDKLSLMAGLAIDKSSSGNGYEITAEIIDVSSSDKSPTFNSTRIQSEGLTIFDGIRNMINISAKALYWSHATTIIVSKEVAKDGILPVLDWIIRDTEPRLSIYILVSEEDSAKEILSSKSLSTEIRSFEIKDMILSNKRLSKIPNIQIHELPNIISANGFYAVIPAVKEAINEKEITMVLSGGAILKGDSLAGFIGLDDVKNYLFVRNKIEGGLLTVNLSEKSSKLNPDVTLEISKNKTKITPILSNGKLSIDIQVKTEVGIGEFDTNMDIMNKTTLEKIKFASEKSLEKDITRTIKKVQEDFGLDIFGFGNTVKEKMPNIWKEIEKDWDEIFMELKVNVKVDIHISGSSHLSKPIEKY